MLLGALRRAAVHRMGHWQLPFAGHVVVVNPEDEAATVEALHAHQPDPLRCPFVVLVDTHIKATAVARALEDNTRWHVRVGCGVARKDLALVQAHRAAVVWVGGYDKYHC